MVLSDYAHVPNEDRYRVLDKLVIKFYNNPIEFLIPLVTNEMSFPKNAFVDKFGKIVVLFDQLVVREVVYAVFEKQFEQRLREHLSGFLKLSKTRMERTKLKAFHIISKEKPEGLAIKQKIGFLVLSENTILPYKEIPDKVYMALRLENNIPVQGMDFDNEMLLNVTEEPVSFTKGCFLGQEILSRVHNYSSPPKKLVRIVSEKPLEKITSEGEEIAKPTSVCYSPKYKKYICFALITNKVNKIDEGDILS